MSKGNSQIIKLEEDKEEEKKNNWLGRTRGIGELPSSEPELKKEEKEDKGDLMGDSLSDPVAELNDNIVKNYSELQKLKTKLDNFDTSLMGIPEEIKPSVIEKYNRDVSRYNELLSIIQTDINKRDSLDLPQDHTEPTWGNVIWHSLKSGLGQYQASLVNVLRLIQMGGVKATDTITNLFDKDWYDPNKDMLLNSLTKIVEDSQKIAVQNHEQAQSKNWLKRFVGTGLEALPQIAGSMTMGFAIPGVTGMAASRPTAEFTSQLLKMTPFGAGAVGGHAREIENEYIAMGKEAPYLQTVVGGVLGGLGEMATELPVFMGVSKLLGKGGFKLVDKGAKTLIGKYGKLGWEYLKDVALQSWQEGEMALIEMAIKEAVGLPQEWTLENIKKRFGEDAYGGLAMAVVLGGLGGGVAGSAKIADSTLKAVDNAINQKRDLRETLKIIAEIQGLIPEEPMAEAMAYEVPKPEEDLLKKIDQGKEYDLKAEVKAGVNLGIVARELKKVERKLINAKVNNLKADIEGKGEAGLFGTKATAKWVTDFERAFNKKPTESQLKEIAREQLTKGYEEMGGKVAPNAKFVAIEEALKKIEEVQKTEEKTLSLFGEEELKAKPEPVKPEIKEKEEPKKVKTKEEEYAEKYGIPVEKVNITKLEKGEVVPEKEQLTDEEVKTIIGEAKAKEKEEEVFKTGIALPEFKDTELYHVAAKAVDAIDKAEINKVSIKDIDTVTKELREALDRYEDKKALTVAQGKKVDLLFNELEKAKTKVKEPVKIEAEEKEEPKKVEEEVETEPTPKVKPVYLQEKAPEFVGDKEFSGDKAKRRNTYLLAKHLYEKNLTPQDLIYYQGSGRFPVDIQYKLDSNFNLSELQKAFNDIKEYGVEELTDKKYIPKIKEEEFFNYLDDLLYRSGKGDKYEQLKPETKPTTEKKSEAKSEEKPKEKPKKAKPKKPRLVERVAEIRKATEKARQKRLEERMQELKEEGYKGTQPGGIKKDELTGEVYGRYGRVSNNPKWYRDFYDRWGKAPTKADRREIALEHLRKGHEEDYGIIPPDTNFIALEKQIEAFEIVEGMLEDIEIDTDAQRTLDKVNKKLDKLERQLGKHKETNKELREEIKSLKKEIQQQKKELKVEKPKPESLKMRIREITGQTAKEKKILAYEGDILKYALKGQEKVSKEAFKAGKKQGVFEQKEKYEERLSKAKERAKQKAYIKKLIDDIQNLSTDNIALDYKDAIESIKKGYDLKQRRKSTLEARQKTAEFIAREVKKGNTEIHIPQKIVDIIRKKTLNEMTVEELKSVHDEIMHLAKLGRLKDKLIKLAQKRRVEKVVDKLCKNIEDNFKKIPKGEVVDLEKETSFHKDLKFKITEYFYNTYRVERICEQLDGMEQDAFWNIFYKSVNDAYSKELAGKFAYIEKFNNFLKNNDINLGKLTTNKKKYQLKHQKVTLTPSLKIGIALASEDVDARRHIQKAYNFTDEDLDYIRGELTEKEKKVAEWLRNHWDEMYEAIDEVYSQLTGKHLPKVENYYPINVLDETMNFDEAIALEFFDVYKRRAYLEKGFTKPRSKMAQQAIKIDALACFLDHLQKTQHYLAYGLITRDLNRIFSSRKLKTTFYSHKKGRVIYDTLKQWFNDVVNPKAYRRHTPLDNFLIFLRKNAAFSMLGLNLVSGTRQLVSLNNAVAEIGLSYMLEGLFKANFTTKEARAFAYKWSEQLKHRRGQVERVIREMAETKGVRKTIEGRETWQEKGLALVKFNDERACLAVWTGAYDKVFKKTGNHEKAVEYADDVVRRTQPMVSEKDLPGYFRMGTMGRLFSMFQNQVNNNWNYINHDIFGKLSKKKITPRQAAHKLIWAWFVPAALLGVISRGRPPKDWKELLFDISTYYGGGFFLIGGMIINAIKGYGGIATPAFAWVEDLAAGIKTKKPYTKAKKFTGALCKILGIAFNQPSRSLEGAWDWLTGQTRDVRRLIWSKYTLEEKKPSKGKPASGIDIYQELAPETIDIYKEFSPSEVDIYSEFGL